VAGAHEDTRTVADVEHPFGLQRTHGLPHRRPAHEQERREVALGGEAAAGLDVLLRDEAKNFPPDPSTQPTVADSAPSTAIVVPHLPHPSSFARSST